MSDTSPDQIDKHNQVTREIIAGIIATEFDDRGFASPCIRSTDRIMEMLARRGYVPQIRACNQLKDGTNL